MDKQFRYKITTKSGVTHEFIGTLTDFDNVWLTYEDMNSDFFLKITRKSIKSVLMIPITNERVLNGI